MGSANAPTDSPRFWLGVACTLSGATLWGFSGACIQFVGENYDITSAFISFVRAAVAAVLFLGLVLATRREALLSIVGSRTARRTLVLFGVGLYFSQITYAISIEYTNAGTATVLQATCTVFVMLFTCLRTRQLPRVPDFVGLLCALAAATLIATQGDWGVIVLPVAGLAWGIANALSETLYIMAPQKLYGHWDRVTIIGCGMVVSGLIAAVVWIVQALIGGEAGAMALMDAGPAITSSAEAAASGAAGGVTAVSGMAGGASAASGAASIDVASGVAAGLVPCLDAIGWLALVGGVGLLGTFAAFGLFLYGVSLVGSVKGSLLGVAEPAGAMIIAALWLGTPFSAADWMGLVLMAVMIALVSLPRGRRKRARRTNP